MLKINEYDIGDVVYPKDTREQLYVNDIVGENLELTNVKGENPKIYSKKECGIYRKVRIKVGDHVNILDNDKFKADEEGLVTDIEMNGYLDYTGLNCFWVTVKGNKYEAKYLTVTNKNSVNKEQLCIEKNSKNRTNLEKIIKTNNLKNMKKIKNEKQLIELMIERYPDFKKIKEGEVNDWVSFQWNSGGNKEQVNFTTNKNVYDSIKVGDYGEGLVFFTKKDLYNWFSEYLIDLRDFNIEYKPGDVVYVDRYGEGKFDELNTITKVSLTSCGDLNYHFQDYYISDEKRLTNY